MSNTGKTQSKIVKEFHVGVSNPGGFWELTIKARSAHEAAEFAELQGVAPEDIDVIQIKIKDPTP